MHKALPEPDAWITDAAWGVSVSFEKPYFGKATWKEQPKLTALYTAAKLQASVEAERERICRMLDAEHEKRKHFDNYAAYYARMIRGLTNP